MEKGSQQLERESFVAGEDPVAGRVRRGTTVKREDNGDQDTASSMVGQDMPPQPVLLRRLFTNAWGRID